MELFSLFCSKITLVQALISIYLLCGVFYFAQWLCADFLISMKDRRNMKELGDLILMSSLLFVIVCCHFPYGSELNRMVAENCAKPVALLTCAANATVSAAHTYLRIHPKRACAHGRHGYRL